MIDGREQIIRERWADAKQARSRAPSSPSQRLRECLLCNGTFSERQAPCRGLPQAIDLELLGREIVDPATIQGKTPASGRQSMATLKEFEEALRENGMHMALAILAKLRERDKAMRSIAPARRVTGRKM